MSSHIVFIIEMFVCWYEWPYELSYCLYYWNVCLLIWFPLWALILSLLLKCLSVNMIPPMSSHIVFIIEMFVCWYDSPYELSYCLYYWNVCLLIWFPLWALILSLSLKFLSLNVIHPMSSHTVFIIEMFVCWYEWPYKLSYCLYHWNYCLLIWFTLWALILSLLLKCLFVNMSDPMSSHIVLIIEASST